MVALLFLFFGLTQTARIVPVRGVPKWEWPKYTGNEFICDQGVKIERVMFNDNFCDCQGNLS
jgi:hypothetical protein